MGATAVLVIDLQVGMFTLLDPPIHEGAQLLTCVTDLLASARAAGVPIIYLQHNTGTAIDGTELWC